MYIPDGFGTVAPYVLVRNAEQYIEFLKDAFGAIELGRTVRDSTIANARIRLGTTTFMISDAGDRMAPSSSAFYLYVENAVASYARALSCGATGMFAPMEMPYGDKQGGVTDPSGNLWWISERLVNQPYD